MSGDGENWLIIDDLVDTGETGKMLKKMLPKAHFATVYAKPLEGQLWIHLLQKYHKTHGFFFPGI